MLVLELAQVPAVEAADDLIVLPAALLGDRRQQEGGDDVLLLPDQHQRVAERGVVGHRQVRRQRPGRRGPDHDRGAGMPDQRKLHIHALADVVLVFDLRLRQRGAAGDAPIDGLLAAIHEALLHNVGEQAQLVGLVFFGERQVRVVPIAQHAEPLELGALDINVLARVGLAGLADGGRHPKRCRPPCACPG